MRRVTFLQLVLSLSGVTSCVAPAVEAFFFFLHFLIVCGCFVLTDGQDGVNHILSYENTQHGINV